MAKAGWVIGAGAVGLVAGAFLLSRKQAEGADLGGGDDEPTLPRLTVDEEQARQDLAGRLLREHGVVGTSIPNSGSRLPSHIYITRDAGALAIRFSIGEDAEGDLLHYQVRVRSSLWASRDIMAHLKEPPVVRLPAGQPLAFGLDLDRTHGPAATPPLQFQVDTGLVVSGDNWASRGVRTDWMQSAILIGQTFPVALGDEGRALVLPTLLGQAGSLFQVRLIIGVVAPLWQQGNLLGLSWSYYRLLDDYAAQQLVTGGVLLPLLISVV